MRDRMKAPRLVCYPGPEVHQRAKDYVLEEHLPSMSELLLQALRYYLDRNAPIKRRKARKG